MEISNKSDGNVYQKKNSKNRYFILINLVLKCMKSITHAGAFAENLLIPVLSPRYKKLVPFIQAF